MVKGKIVCLDHDVETVTVYVKDYQFGDHCAAKCEAPKVGVAVGNKAHWKGVGPVVVTRAGDKSEVLLTRADAARRPG